MNFVPQSDEQLREAVRTRYAGTALQVLGTGSTDETACCGSSCCTPGEAAETQPTQSEDTASSCCTAVCCIPDTHTGNAITSDLYTQMELGEIPIAAALASLGCGNPTALAETPTGRESA